jgi:hypothetical protein
MLRYIALVGGRQTLEMLETQDVFDMAVPSA